MKLSIIPALNSKLNSKLKENIARHHEDRRAGLGDHKSKVENELRELTQRRDHLTHEIEQLQAFLEHIHKEMDHLEPQHDTMVAPPGI